ncbi:MAG: oligosaccharide flippase family protein [Chloroflexi bacterium]|nr:oligosaccharide flippase family protein [Chloroflexota bacterium]
MSTNHSAGQHQHLLSDFGNLGARESVSAGGFALGIRQFVSVPFNVLGAGAATALLTPTDFGIQAVVVILVSVSFILLDLGLTEALVQSRVEAGLKTQRKVNMYRLVALLPTGLAIYLGSSSIVERLSLPAWTLLLLTSSVFVGWLQSQRYFQSHSIQRQLGWITLARVEVVELAIYNVVLVITAYLFRTAVCFALATAAQAGLGAIVLSYLGRTYRTTDANRDGGDQFTALVRFGIQIQVPKVMSLVQNLLNPLLVGAVAGISTVGLVNWSIYVVALPRVLLRPMPDFFFSVVAESNRRGNSSEYIVRLIRVGANGLAVLSLVMALWLPWLVSRFLGSRWMEAVPIVIVLLLGNVTYFPTLALRAYLNGSGYPKYTIWVGLVEMLLMWTIISIAVLSVGGLGFAIGEVLVRIISFLVASWFARRATGVRLPIVQVIGVTFFTAVAYGIAGLFVFNGMAVWFEAVIRTVVGSLVILVLVLVVERKVLREDVGWFVTLLARMLAQNKLVRQIRAGQKVQL